MAEENELSIHKRNEIIRGGNTYSLTAQKLGNAVYHHVQINKVFKNERFNIPMSILRETMGLENSNNYHITIRKALKELAEPIELYNIDRISGMGKIGQETLWQVAQFLIEPKVVKVGKEQYINTQMSPTLRLLIASSNEGNFTQLVLNTHLNNVKSKHSYILYEYLKSFENFNIIGNRIEFAHDRLDKMFNLEHKKKYLYFSSFKALLERAIEDLNANTDMSLRLSVDKSLKKYYIHRIKHEEAKHKQKKKDEGYKRFEDHPLGKLTDDVEKEIKRRGDLFTDLIIDVDIEEESDEINR